jgi:CBS domain-containing protein
MSHDPRAYIGKELRRKLADTRVGELLPAYPKLISARTNETLATVFNRLIDNRIFAVPLWDILAGYVGFVGVFDFLAYIIEILGFAITSEWHTSEKFHTTTVADMVARRYIGRWVTISEHASLQTAVNLLHDYHRIAVLDREGNLVRVLTQGRVVRWLAVRTDWTLGPIASMTVEDFALGYGYVASVLRTERTLDAFLRMYRQNYSGLAVVDEADTVIGNISVSDLKEIDYDAKMFHKLLLSAEEFINRKSESGLIPKLVYCTRTATIKDVLEMFKDYRIHRVYVVTETLRKPLGVITMTDMIGIFANDGSTQFTYVA